MDVEPWHEDDGAGSMSAGLSDRGLGTWEDQSTGSGRCGNGGAIGKTVTGTGVVETGGTGRTDRGVRFCFALSLSSIETAADIESELRSRARFGSIVVVNIFEISSSA
jgi:hypothetical protein